MKLLRALMLAGLSALFVILLFMPSQKKSGSSSGAAAARAGERLTRANMELLQQVLGQYIADQGESPSSLNAVRSSGLMMTGINDAWGRAFLYKKLPGTSYRLTSAGRDGRFETDDDIVADY